MQQYYYHTSENRFFNQITILYFLAILFVFILAGTLVHYRKLNLQIEREIGEINNQITVVKSENSDLRRRMTELASPVRVLGSVRCDSLEEETIKPHDVIITKGELDASRTNLGEDLFSSDSEKDDESLVAALGNSAFFTGSAHAKE